MLAPFTAGSQTTNSPPLIIERSEVLNLYYNSFAHKCMMMMMAARLKAVTLVPPWNKFLAIHSCNNVLKHGTCYYCCNQQSNQHYHLSGRSMDNQLLMFFTVM